MFSVCFGIKMLIFLLRDDFESLKYCLDPWLSCMLDCIHICVFPFLKNCFKANSIDSRHLSIARWIDRESVYPLNSSLTNPRSIELPFALVTCLIDASVEPFKARQILDTSRHLVYLSSSSIDFYHNLNTSR